MPDQGGNSVTDMLLLKLFFFNLRQTVAFLVVKLLSHVHKYYVTATELVRTAKDLDTYQQSY